MVGRRESSATRSSMADTSERQREGEFEAAEQRAHLLLGALGRLLLRIDGGHRDEVLEHLDVGRVHRGGVDADLLHVALAVGIDGDHASAGRPGDGDLEQRLLHLVGALLHLLGLGDEVVDIHGPYSMRRRSSASIAASSMGSRLRSCATRRSRTLSSVSRSIGTAGCALMTMRSTPVNRVRRAASRYSAPWLSASPCASVSTASVTVPLPATASGVA